MIRGVMSLDCSDSEQNHDSYHPAKRLSKWRALGTRQSGWSPQLQSIQSGGIATPPPSPPLSTSSNKETLHEEGTTIKRRSTRRADSIQSEPEVKRRRVDSSPNTIFRNHNFENTPPTSMDDGGPPLSERYCEPRRPRRGVTKRDPNIQRRLTRSLATKRTVFYELGQSSTSTDCTLDCENHISTKITVNIPRRHRKQRTMDRSRRTLTDSSADSVPTSNASSRQGTFWLFSPLEQRRCDSADEQTADENWRWATQPSDDSEDDWRWRTQSRCSSWEEAGG